MLFVPSKRSCRRIKRRVCFPNRCGQLEGGKGSDCFSSVVLHRAYAARRQCPLATVAPSTSTASIGFGCLDVSIAFALLPFPPIRVVVHVKVSGKNVEGTAPATLPSSATRSAAFSATFAGIYATTVKPGYDEFDENSQVSLHADFEIRRACLKQKRNQNARDISDGELTLH